MFAKLATVIVLTLVNFSNIQKVNAVMCTYELADNYSYICHLVKPFKSRSIMIVETGTHLPGFSNNDVTILLASQSTIIEIFPNTLINKFINLQRVNPIAVRMKSFTNKISFCDNISHVMLLGNEISFVRRRDPSE